MRKFFSKKQYHLGIEIDAGILRAIVCGKNKHTLEIIQKVEQKLNLTDILLFPAVIIQFIEEYFSRKLPITLGITYKKTIFKEISLEHALTETQLLLHLETQAKNYFGHNLSELYYDWQRLKSNSESKHFVALAAARKESLDTLINVCTQECLNLKAIEIDLFAALRVIKLLARNYAAAKIYGLINIKYFDLQVAVFCDDKIIYLKQEEHGSDYRVTVGSLLQQYQNLHYDKPLSQIFIAGEEHKAKDLLTSLDSNYKSLAEIWVWDKYPDLSSQWLTALGLSAGDIYEH